MITERELDARLAAAAGFDEALPPLPEDFLQALREEAGSDPIETLTAADREPASVVAARQLVADAREARNTPRLRRRRPGRRALLRAGVAVVSIAAAGATAVIIAPSDAARTPDGEIAAPTSEITLVAAEQATFPLSLDPSPEGLTRTLSRSGGPTPAGVRPVVFTAEYRAADGAGFTVWASTQDPRGEWQYEFQQPQDDYAPDDVIEAGTVSVGHSEADLVRARHDQPLCRFAPSTPTQTDEPATVCTSAFADLIWERRDGHWVWIRGEEEYADTSAVVAVAEALIDRPVPVDLQVGLAPAGWSVTSYADDEYVAVVSDENPDQRVTVALQETWRGYTPDNMLDYVDGLGPVTEVTVDGRPAQLALVEDSWSETHKQWWLAGQFADGTLFFLNAPREFTRDDVLAMAEQITYTP
ncbi:hypothetical protein [Blastococcus sp. SYSU DS0828]